MADLPVPAAIKTASVAATASQAGASRLSYTGGPLNMGTDEVVVRWTSHACCNTEHTALGRAGNPFAGCCEELAGKTLRGWCMSRT